MDASLISYHYQQGFISCNNWSITHELLTIYLSLHKYPFFKTVHQLINNKYIFKLL
jgi:hypothetical protein